MSQKTNPLSLRLQKGNQNFFSPWFTDFFFSENFQHESEIRKYINTLLQETQYSKAFFSAKSEYRKCNVLFGIHDKRAQKKEKQLLFNLKSSLSRDIAIKKSKKIESFISSSDSKNGNTLKIFDSSIFLDSLEKSSIHFFFREKVRNQFLKIKQNYNLKSVFLTAGIPFKTAFLTPSKTSEQSQQASFGDSSLLLNQQNASICYFKKKIKNRSTFAFCEKIASGDYSLSLKEKQNKYFFPTFFGKSLLYDENKAFLDTIQNKSYSIGVQEDLLRYFGKEKGVATHLEPIRFIKDSQNAVPLLDQIILLLEKRVSFREIVSKILQNFPKDQSVKGVRITCSGRLGGRSKKAQKAKMQSHQWGETSLNTFSSRVLFAHKSAMTSYGKVGVKIWLSFKTTTR